MAGLPITRSHELRPVASAALLTIALIGVAMLLILGLLPAALVAASAS
jgi:hypothetical protein